MLKKILSGKTCAECRICCSFDAYDIWETPVINDELKEKILEIKPQQKFITKDNNYLFRMEEADDGLFYCPMLSEKGCVLGDEKPFDCRIWPFRVMKYEDRLLITISPICPSLFNTPLNDIMEFLKTKSLTKRYLMKQRKILQ